MSENIIVDNSFFKEISKKDTVFISNSCINKLKSDTVLYNNSKYKKLNKIIFVSIKEQGDIDYSRIVKQVLKISVEKDFEHPIIKVFALKLFLASIITKDGLSRKLSKQNTSIQRNIKQRNILTVLLNHKNELFVGGKLIKINELCKIVKQFYDNPKNDSLLSEKKEIEISQIGKVKVSKGVISLQNYRRTKYEFYIQVQNEIVRAINELRDKSAKKYFKKEYKNLSDKNKKYIRKICPMSISEAESKRLKNN